MATPVEPSASVHWLFHPSVPLDSRYTVCVRFAKSHAPAGELGSSLRPHSVIDTGVAYPAGRVPGGEA